MMRGMINKKFPVLGSIKETAMYYAKLKHVIMKNIGRPNRIIHCLGDSHVEVFEYISRMRVFSRTTFLVSIAHGGTALGMVNPNSKSNALKMFTARMQIIPKSDYLLFMVGEVDCTFLLWYRAQKYKTTVSEQLQCSLDNYFKYLGYVRDIGYQNIIVCMAHLPAAKDGEIPEIRSNITGSHRDRTRLVSKYNSNLRQFCCEHRINVLDIERQIMNCETGVIDEGYPDNDRIHLKSDKIAPYYVAQLKELGFS